MARVEKAARASLKLIDVRVAEQVGQRGLRKIGPGGMIRRFAGAIPHSALGALLQLSRRSNPCGLKSGVLSSG